VFFERKEEVNNFGSVTSFRGSQIVNKTLFLKRYFFISILKTFLGFKSKN